MSRGKKTYAGTESVTTKKPQEIKKEEEGGRKGRRVLSVLPWEGFPVFTLQQLEPQLLVSSERHRTMKATNQSAMRRPEASSEVTKTFNLTGGPTKVLRCDIEELEQQQDGWMECCGEPLHRWPEFIGFLIIMSM